MLSNPAHKYAAFNGIDLSDRAWPDKKITSPPIWLSTDLRDGNQALIEPMTRAKKLKFFELLVDIGLKEIEVAFPAASQTDFDFVRHLIENDLVPNDVIIAVLTQSREDLIRTTIESLKGAPRAIVHLYLPIAATFRRIVFNSDRQAVKEIALHGARLIKALTDARPETDWVFEFSPETFSACELEYAKEVCDAIVAVWNPSPERKMIINLPATVEMSTPNIFADHIEWMSRNLNRRESIILSVHPHNDRGTAIAAAELAIMAGAERVEGCLFGNGERTGNVDLVTLALNLYTQGIHPGIDISDIDQIRQVVEYCNQLPVHPRHPYAGDLVFTAFSGSHQDAIKKGLAQQTPGTRWEVPYLPIDPADLNRSYDAVIRVNSQSGKGGVSYILQQEYGLDLPRRLQIEFSRAIKRVTDLSGKEIAPQAIYALFSEQYLEPESPYRYRGHNLSERNETRATNDVTIHVEIELNGKHHTVVGVGNGPIDAFIHGLGVKINVLDYHEHSIGSGAAAKAACYIEMQVNGAATLHGAGVDQNIVAAALKAVLSGINRSLVQQSPVDCSVAI
ncbi:MAG: 2-isopropylmalate synthase [Gammaproteobacteria bacterium]|nr:2-isopropylmalate synthase [Gammaproteobacteria bacterium]